MARLIDAEALYRDVSGRAYTDDLGTTLAVILAEDAIAHAPSVDAIPIVWLTEQGYEADEELSVAAHTVIEAWRAREKVQ